MAYSPALHVAKQVEKKMVASGTMARIDAKAAQHAAYAQSLGYDNAQQAFKALGKAFIAQANAYQPVAEPVQQAVGGFVSLVVKGWTTDLAFECSYDGIFDLIEKEAFLNLCQVAVKEKACAALN